MNKEILQKYINNNCSDKEFEELTSWVNSNNVYNEESKKWSYDLWKSFHPEDESNSELYYSVLLDKIHHRINLKSSKNTENKSIRYSRVIRLFRNAAAILFIPLLIAGVYLMSNIRNDMDDIAEFAADSVEVIAPVGAITVVNFSDGSVAHLNYGSRLKYPFHFSGKNREVVLTGEGYFEVASNPDKPFIVNTGKLNVTAVGTAFNVQAYPDNEFITSTLIEGKVLIEKNMAHEGKENVGYMIPGQHLSYNLKTGNITSKKVNTYKYTAWKDGKLVFDNAPIIEVTRALSRKYNVEIIVDESIQYLTYTVTFSNDPLFLILDLMSETTPITYERVARERQSDGTVSKQKILITKR